MGVQKGSILSVTLFSLKINSLADVLKNDMQGSLYVDDFVLCYKSKTRILLNDNYNSVYKEFKLGHTKMDSDFQKLKLPASIFAPNANFPMIRVCN